MKKLLAGLLAATMAVGMSVSAFAAMVDYIEVEPKEPFTVSGTSVNYELGTSYGDVYADTWTTRAVDYLESTIDVNTDAMGGTDATSKKYTYSDANYDAAQSGTIRNPAIQVTDCTSIFNSLVFKGIMF